MSRVERPTCEKPLRAMSALLRRGRRLLERGRGRDARHGEVLAEGGVEVPGDLRGREAALLVERGDRLRGLEEGVGVAATAEDLAVHVRGEVRGEEGDDGAVEVGSHL